MELITNLFSNINAIELLGFIGAIIFFAARLDSSTKSNKETINAEIAHVLKLMEINHQNIKEDISRLEKKQEESNKIKERLAMQEVLVADIQSILRTHLAEFHNLTLGHNHGHHHD